MVKIVEEEVEESDATTPSPYPTTSSSHRQSPPASHPSSPLPVSPDSVSSLSSDQTFHGFSPKPSPSHNDPPERQNQLAISAVASRLIREEPIPPVTRTESGPVSGFAVEGRDDVDKGGGREGGVRKGKASISSLSYLRRSRRVVMARKMALGLRVCEFVFCLISFSVMASDKNRGWALDSFDRYVEFRYCLSVNVVGFSYSVIQGYSLVYQLTRGKQVIWGQFRCCFDFLLDQILAYLLVSASSSAATRVDDWILNLGQDKFPAMASASIGMSFLAFVAFALNSMISGYIVCTHI